MQNEDGQIHLVVNGEFYDFEQMRSELSRRGHVFQTQSDSEVAIHLYEERGIRSLHALRGEFAFAIWDERDGQLFAARDRFGIKPLYYTLHDGQFYLASEVKAFRELGVPLRWDRETLYDTHFVSHPPDRTLFAGISQVPPGSYLLTDGGQVRVIQYWDWNFPLEEETQNDRNSREWVERIEQALVEAVRLRLRADVPVACYLSGGIDSAAVLGFASRLSTRPLRAYTLSFDHPRYDEAALAEQQARFSGADFYRCDIRSEHLANHFSDAIYYAERPFANAHAVAKYLLSRTVRDTGIKVVLTGEGGDEIFAGYPQVVLDESRSGKKQADMEQLKTGISAPAPGAAALESVRRQLGYVPSNLEVWAEFGSGLLDVLAVEFAAMFSGRNTYRVLLNYLDIERQMAGRHIVNQSLYLWGKTMLPNYILSSVGDRMEMAHSVEGRLPFLDHHLVEEAARMPVKMKINGTTAKYVLREAARPVVTDAVYQRQKQAFVAPPSTLQPDNMLYAFVQDTLRCRTLEHAGIYNRDKVIGLLDRIDSMNPAARERVDALLMWITSLCLLQERLALT